MTLKLDWKRSLLFTAFISLLLVLISVAQVVYAAAPGDIVINEIIPDPSAVSDANGEWFEVANTTAGAIDIDGWTIQDNGSDSHVINNGGPLLVPAGGFVVLARNADNGTNGGVTAVYEYSGITLGNSDDELILLDTGLVEIDRVEYDGGPNFPDPSGATMSLISPALDNNLGSNWCTASTPFGAGDLGTPGAANDCPTPSPGDIVVNEIMKDPSAVSDTNGEWVELVNTAAFGIDIDGWTLADDGSDSHVINNGGSLIIPSGGTIVLGNNGDIGTNGGVTVDYVYSGFTLANADDEVVLLDGGAVEIDRVNYDDGITFPDPAGATMSLIGSALDNNVGGNWCTASTPYGAGDLGTPGAANDCPVAGAGDIIVNEIMQNPAAVSDTAGEWIELHNVSGTSVDINNWTLADDGSDSHQINNGGPLVIPAGGYIVLARNGDSGTNGGLTVDYVYSSFSLSNGEDEVVLLDDSLIEIDRVNYNDGATFPDPTGATMSLEDPLLNNNNGAHWCVASTPYGSGDLGTPGAANDCIPFVPDAGDVVVHEIMSDPSAVSDANGEWIELANATPRDINIEGWTIADNGTESHVINTGGPFFIPGGGFAVLARNGDSGTNGGVTVDYVYSGFTLGNTDDEVILLDGSLVEIDRVEYDGGPNYPDPTGATLSLIHPAFDNSVGANWCTAVTPFGAGDSGTPGAYNDCPPGSVRIHHIQGAAHLSLFNFQAVQQIAGIVTAVDSNGFWMQEPDATVDGDVATSEGIFVFTDSAPTVAVADDVLVDGTVTEFRPGSRGLSITEITNPIITVNASGVTLPSPTVIGTGGRIPPTAVIDDDATGSVDTSGTFDATTDGIDFYESLEGMRVQINNALVVAPTSEFGGGTSKETWVVGDNGANTTSLSPRGSIVIASGDFNPERIQLDARIYPGGAAAWQSVSTGAAYTSPVLGVMHYSFENFEVEVTDVVTVDTTNEVTPEVTTLTGAADSVTIATYNVENLGGDAPMADFDARADQIVNNLLSPDIIVLEELQDNNGATNDAIVDASVTFNTLITAITNAGGPTYAFEQINPLDDEDGGQPGGNIRVGFLYNTARVGFTARPGGDATTANTVTCNAGVAELDLSPGRIDPTNTAFDNSRKPISGEFTFNGETLYIIGLHFNSKGGDDPLFGVLQPPTFGSEAKRGDQAQAVNDFVDTILACDANANIVVLGDVNDFGFSAPVATLEGGVLTNLGHLLPANEQYSFIFQGNAQELDHIFVSDNLNNNHSPELDVVHVNAEFFTQVSDHDPGVSRFSFATAVPTCNGLTATVYVDGGLIVGGPDNGLAYAGLLRGTGSADVIVGTSGIDDIRGFGGADTICAGDGSDIVTGNGGGDTIFGEGGADNIRAGGGADTVHGGDGNDDIRGNNGNDTLNGDGDNDSIRGGRGDDIVNGNAGDDALWGNADVDICNGGTGTDTAAGNCETIIDVP